MAKSTMLAWSTPVDPERDAEFNDWYENTHVPQVRAAIPSITGVSRHRVIDLEGKGGPVRYLAIYEIDGDIAEAAQALGSAGAEGRLTMTTAMDTATFPPELQWAQAL